MMSVERGVTNWSCTSCGKVMSSYAEVGYEGPEDPSDVSCSPFQAWKVLCTECAAKQLEAEG